MRLTQGLLSCAYMRNSAKIAFQQLHCIVPSCAEGTTGGAKLQMRISVSQVTHGTKWTQPAGSSAGAQRTIDDDKAVKPAAGRGDHVHIGDEPGDDVEQLQEAPPCVNVRPQTIDGANRSVCNAASQGQAHHDGMLDHGLPCCPNPSVAPVDQCAPH